MEKLVPSVKEGIEKAERNPGCRHDAGSESVVRYGQSKSDGRHQIPGGVGAQARGKMGGRPHGNGNWLTLTRRARGQPLDRL